jgi:hemolysin activation/secretion protein
MMQASARMKLPILRPEPAAAAFAAAGLAVLVVMALALPAAAQVGPLLGSPEETRPELPPLEPEPPPILEQEILPPVEIPREPGTEGLAGGARVVLREVRIRGNTVLPEATLSELARSYVGREVRASDLETLRDRITRAYVDAGYVTSGAVVPPQELDDGVLEVDVIEGRLASVVVSGEGRLRPRYVRSRLELGDAPVNVHALEEKLQLLQQDRNVRHVAAELAPGELRGESVLRVRVVETDPWRVALAGDNYRSPSIGSTQGTFETRFRNLTGFGDLAVLRYQGTEGLHRAEGSWALPLTGAGTELEAHFQWSDADVVEEPFDDFDISSSLVTAGLTVSHPLYRTPRTRLAAFLTGEWRRSRSYLLGEGFSFTPGPEEGRATVTVLRPGLEFSTSTRSQAFAARTQLSLGVDTLNATSHSRNIPDGQFLSWLTQLQYALRLPWWDMQLVARGDLQVTDDPLLTMEQLAMGGRYTVRGYRENQVIGDGGAIGSLELRIPLPFDLPLPDERSVSFELLPFFDAGRSWSRKREDLPKRDGISLMSAGVGLRASLGERLTAEVFWAESLKNLDTLGPHDLQDSGISFQIRGVFP